MQISLCAGLITSFLVAVRGLLRSLHGRFGFDPTHSILVKVDLHMGGYGEDRETTTQRCIDS